MRSLSYEEADHTADWALVARGRDLDELLVNAAQGMMDLMGLQPGDGPSSTRSLRLEALDPEGLLVAWLEELLYGVETRGVAYTRFDVHSRDGRQLEGTVEEVPASTVQRLIKAVTYHGLRIEKTPHGFQATVVFDV